MLEEFALVACQGIVERLDEGVGVDEAAGKCLPGRENLGLLHLVERFATDEQKEKPADEKDFDRPALKRLPKADDGGGGN